MYSKGTKGVTLVLYDVHIQPVAEFKNVKSGEQTPH